MIKVIVNDVSLDLKSGAVIALSKKSADIGTLQNRFSSFTNKFQVVNTKKNRDALGIKQYQDTSFGIEQQIGGAQYQELTGKLVSNGIEIASNVAVIIESVAEDITLTIRAGNGNLFDRLNRTKINELDFSDINHIWTATEVVNAINYVWSDGYTYPLCQTGAQSKTVETALIQGIIPFVYAKNIMNRIASLFGYSFIGDTADNDQYERLALPVATLNMGAGANELLKITMTAIPFSLSSPTDLVFWPNFNVNTDEWGLAFDTGNTNELVGLTKIYFVPLPGQYTVEFDYDVTVFNNEPITPATLFTNIHLIAMQRSPSGFIEIARSTTVLNPVNVLTPVNFTGTASLSFSMEEIFDEVPIWDTPGQELTAQGAYVYVQFENDAGAYTIDVDLNGGVFRIQDVIVKETHYFRPLSFGDHLPDWTLGKFIKEVANIFGAIYDVDEFTKEIEITRMDEIAANRDEAYDWTDKLDLSFASEITYLIDGIGKTTVWTWKDDTIKAKNVSVINNQLPDSSNYVQSDAVPSIDEITCGQSDPVLSANLWDFEKNRIKTDGDARFAMIRSDNSFLQIAGLKVLPTVVNPHNSAYFDYKGADHSLAWPTLYNRYYQQLFEPMTWYMNKVVAHFKLTDLDIQQFRFKYPVYIKHFNRYFYVNEISEFTGKDQSTKCTLIAI